VGTGRKNGVRSGFSHRAVLIGKRTSFVIADAE